MLQDGRTRGLLADELPNPLRKRMVFYEGGLAQMNIDLGLEPTSSLFAEHSESIFAPKQSSQKHKKIEVINKKIDKIAELLNPSTLQKLQDELVELEKTKDGADELEILSAKSQEISAQLISNVDKALVVNCGYLYFKRWVLPDVTWYKIGITNSPKRRDSEQNVLPVPAETISLVRLDSMEQARSVEKAFHRSLASRLVTGAKNKELFKLRRIDYKAVMNAISFLQKRLDSSNDGDID